MPATTYQWLTYAQARTDIAQRLSDSGNVHWLNSGTFNELGLYIQEALRTWQTLTGYWRAQAILAISASTSFYDLTATLSPSLRSYNVTDTYECAMMQYQLSENLGSPAPGASWTGTSMFNLSDFTVSLQQRRDQFLVETGSVLSVPSPIVCSPAQSRYTFATDSVIDVRRMAWIDGVSGIKTVLWRQDEWQMNAYNPGWTVSQGTNPQAYSLAASPPLTFALAPFPVASGSVELITVNAGDTLNPASGVLLGIPDDYSPIVKWGALAELLDYDGPSPDPVRAKYCEDRWESGIRIARLAPCIVACQINSLGVFPTSLWDMDMYNPGWENLTSGPFQIAAAGLNLAVMSPGNYSTSPLPGVLLDVIQNAPIPASDGDYLQLGREEWDAVGGYAQHLAAFKLGGDEFLKTLPLYHNFLKEASVYADRLAAYAPMTRDFALQMHTECEKVYRRLTDSQIEVSTAR